MPFPDPMFLAFSFAEPAARSVLRRAARRLCRHVPDTFEAVPVIWRSECRQLALFHWVRQGESPEERLLASADEAVALDGYLSSPGPGRSMAATLAARLAHEGTIHGSGGAGGVAAMVHARNGRLRLWTTQPPTHGIYHAAGRLFDGSHGERAPPCAVAGPRPLLVHLAARGGLGLALSRERVGLRLAAASVLDHGTLFEGVRRLWPTSALELAGGIATELPLDLPPPGSALPPERQAAELSAALMAAVSPVRGGGVLLASGGKDSRTIAAACHAAAVPLQAMTHGAEGGEEAETARAMTARLGIELDLRRQRIHSDPVAGAMRTILRTDGQIAYDCMQLAYDAPVAFGRPVLHGQGHLLRGGGATRAAYALPGQMASPAPRSGLFARLGRRPAQPPPPAGLDLFQTLEEPFVSGWVMPALNESVRALLDRWRAGRPVGDPREWLYLVHHDLRVGVHIAPVFLDLTRANRMIFPLLDENVVALANRLPFEDRVSERAVFRAIRAMAPALTELPLFGEMWRFEKDGPAEGFDGRDLRLSTFDKDEFRQTRSGLAYFGPRPSGPGLPAAAFLRDSAFWPEVRGLLTSRMAAVVDELALHGELPAAERTRRKAAQTSAIRKMNELFGLAVLFCTDWLVPVREAPPLERFAIVSAWPPRG